jgi:hypothetical protein
MAIPGTVQTYDLTTGVKLDVEDIIWLISPFDVPLQGMYGADGRTAISVDTVFEKKAEWLDETLLTPRSTFGAALSTTTGTVLQVATGDQAKFQTGDVLFLSSVSGASTEYVQVTAYGTTADTLLVSRGWASTTASTFATADNVVGVGAAQAEGSDPPAARAVDRVDRFNYTQIFGPTAITVSETENAVQKYGLTGTEFDHQTANRLKEQAISLEQALINGVVYAGTGTLGRTLGGFTNYITSNVDSSTTAISDSTILAQVQACYDAGGSPDRLMVGSHQKRAISALESSEIRYAQATNIRGQTVDYFDTDFGRLSVVLNRWCLPNQAFIYSRDQATIGVLRPASFQMLAKTGDAQKGMVVAEKTLYFRRQSWAARFTALT